MQLKNALAGLAIALVGIGTPLAVAAPAIAVQDSSAVVSRTHPCTHTSSGSCIRGGQFCPQASYGYSGWDAQGRRYVCKGNRTHPHWMRP